MRVVEADELRLALPVTAAIDALEAAFREEDPDAAAPVRSSLETAAGSLLLMPAQGVRGVGVKLVTLTGANPGGGLPFVQASYVWFDRVTQTPEAVIDGTALTTLRTAAVSGLATRWLARAEASRLALFGAGVQARGHLDAMLAVRPIDEVIVVSRSADRAAALVALAREQGASARTGTAADVAGVDLVCTCTTSPVPVFDGAELSPGVHVNAVGAYEPTTREVDSVAVARARVVVETRSVAAAEAGTVLLPVNEGAVPEDPVVADLAEVVRGTEVRRSADDLTLFVSVGMAFEDLVVARAAIEALS